MKGLMKHFMLGGVLIILASSQMGGCGSGGSGGGGNPGSPDLTPNEAHKLSIGLLGTYESIYDDLSYYQVVKGVSGVAQILSIEGGVVTVRFTDFSYQLFDGANNYLQRIHGTAYYSEKSNSDSWYLHLWAQNLSATLSHGNGDVVASSENLDVDYESYDDGKTWNGVAGGHNVDVDWVRDLPLPYGGEPSNNGGGGNYGGGSGGSLSAGD